MFNIIRKTVCIPIRILLNNHSKAFISQAKIQNLKICIDKQIDYQIKEKVDLSKTQNYFKSNNWSLKYNGVQIQLQKKLAPYTVNILFNIRSPVVSEQKTQQQMLLNQSLQQDKDIFNLAIYVGRGNLEKRLKAEYLVSDQGYEIVSAHFISDYEEDKKKMSDYNRDHKVHSGYDGPTIHSLEQRLVISIKSFVTYLGIDNQFLDTASQLSLQYEQKFYLEWLKDMRSLL